MVASFRMKNYVRLCMFSGCLAVWLFCVVCVAARLGLNRNKGRVEYLRAKS